MNIQFPVYNKQRIKHSYYLILLQSKNNFINLKSMMMVAMYVGGLVFYLRYLCLFAHSGVQHTLYCVFVLFFFVMLPVSLDCPFLIAPSVISNVYLSLVVTKYCT